jgi:hypothetical protein
MSDENGERPRSITDEQIAIGQVREVVRELGVLADLVRDELRPAVAGLRFQLQELGRDTTRDLAELRERICVVEGRVGVVEDNLAAVAAIAAAR